MRNMVIHEFFLSQRLFIRVIGLISGIVLGIGLIMEHVFHIPACNMCVLERYPYAVIMFLYLMSFILHSPQFDRLLPWFFTLIFLISMGLSFYHVGIEHHIFELPSFCGNTAHKSFQNVAALKEYLRHQKEVIRCDIVPLRIFNLSLAEWNFFLSLFLLGATVYHIKINRKNVA